jgi:hypothetical protein
MKYFLSLAAISTFIFACTATARFTGQQGISGKVVWLEGNLMPGIGDTTYRERLAGIPVQRKLFIYEPATSADAVKTSESEVLYSEIHSKLIKDVETNSDGTFQIELDPGRYSIFTLEEKGLFANIFDGEGIINPVTVEAGKFTEIQIKVNYKAFF